MPPQHNPYLNTEIPNLPLYLSTFQTCVLHIINYRSISIPPVPQPVILSRYEVITPNYYSPSVGDSSYNPHRFLVLNNSRGFTYGPDERLNSSQLELETALRTFKLNISRQQRGWTCLARFYIFPRATWPPSDIGEEAFSSPSDAKFHLNCFPRPGYHVLLIKPMDNAGVEETMAYWNVKFNRLLRRNELLEILIVKTSRVSTKVVKIIEFLICCRYCSRFWRTFVNFPTKTETGIKFEEMLYFIEITVPPSARYSSHKKCT